MTLVRIIPRLHEYPTELVRDLRARGFTVETQYAPRAQKSADLEIKLEQYSYDGFGKDLTKILAGSDVVVLAGTGAKGQKIRSIGMVLLSPESELHTANKTAVPEPLNELYLALLRGRANPERARVLQFARNAIRRSSSYLGKQCGTLAGSMKQVRMPAFTIATPSADLLKRWRNARTSRRNTGRPEPDLVPSMFGLSASEPDQANIPPNPELAPAPTQSEPRPTMWYSRNWRPISVAAAAVLACFLWLFSFSHTAATANQSPHLAPTESKTSADTLPPPVSPTRNVTKVASARTAEKAAGDADGTLADDKFQEVVVRHFSGPSTPSSKTDHPAAGVKRVVIVD